MSPKKVFIRVTIRGTRQTALLQVSVAVEGTLALQGGAEVYFAAAAPTCVAMWGAV